MLADVVKSRYHIQIFRYNHKCTFRKREEGDLTKTEVSVPKEAATAVIWPQDLMPITPEAPRGKKCTIILEHPERGQLC